VTKDDVDEDDIAELSTVIRVAPREEKRELADKKENIDEEDEEIIDEISNADASEESGSVNEDEASAGPLAKDEWVHFADFQR